MRRHGWLLAMAMAITPEAALADWYKASSPHFVIYSKERPEELREYAEQLEKFDQAVRQIRQWDDPKLGDGNRLTIYVVDSVSAVQRIYGKRGYVYGFFQPRYTGPTAFTPRSADKTDWGLTADAVFFHEYGHHLMFQQFDLPFPTWFVEGFAELVATAKFERDGALTLGLPPKYRAYNLVNWSGISTAEMLQSRPDGFSNDKLDGLYGRGWLLTHYLLFDTERKGQLGTYFKALMSGKDMPTAANEAFGDLKALDKDLQKYLRRPSMTVSKLPSSSLPIGKIEISALSAAANDVLPLQMLSKRGVSKDQAAELAPKIRAIAEANPKDAFVQTALAEAEFDVQRFDQALAAADAALAIQPRNVEALCFRGRALMELADKGGKAANYVSAREAFSLANKIDPEDPEPLYLFYESFVRAGEMPTENAISALHYAALLSPADQGVRASSAIAWLNQKRYREASAELMPIAYDPHGGELSKAARAALDQIASGKPENALAAIIKLRDSGDASDAGADSSNSARP